jgi:hypothetical protein
VMTGTKHLLRVMWRLLDDFKSIYKWWFQKGVASGRNAMLSPTTFLSR